MKQSLVVILKGIGEQDAKRVDDELRRKQIQFAVTHDKIKRSHEYRLTLTAEGQKYMLPVIIKKQLGLSR